MGKELKGRECGDMFIQNILYAGMTFSEQYETQGVLLNVKVIVQMFLRKQRKENVYYI